MSQCRTAANHASMIHLEGITKRFGMVWALRGISLQLEAGKCLGIFGPNGAGKTTLLKILATLTRPTEGRIFIAGYDALREAARIRPLLGVLSHRTFLYGHLTAVENLQFYGQMFGVHPLATRIHEVLQMLGLEAGSQQLVRTYSRGMQQRLAIARVILPKPVLLLLDEPYTGLDQQAVTHVQQLLRQLLAERCTIIMSTHDLQRGLDICHEFVIQNRGKLTHHGQMTQFSSQEFEEFYARHVV